MTSYTFSQLIDFTRTTSGTYTNSSGFITSTPASVNLLTYTQEFANAAWSKGTGVTVAANAGVAPDGTQTADNVTFAAGGASEFLRTLPAMTVGVTYTYSIWVRLISGSPTFTFDVGNGTPSASQTPTSVWQRFTHTFTFSGPNQWIDIQLSAAATLAFWGAQLELGSTATDYTRNYGGLYPPRFDYDPVTLAPKGLLIEEARTNLLTYSEDWTNAAWSKTNITVTAAATTSPDGTLNAQKLAATATAIALIITATVAVAATSATYSIYVKQGTGATTANNFGLRNQTTSTNLVFGSLNYSTGVFTYTVGSTGVTVTNAGNGWWRLQITATSGITSGDTISGYVGWTGSSATAGDFLYAYGAQLEAGAFATSYIPTVASQVTRTADVAAINAPNFASWYNQSEGTFVVQWDAIGYSASQMLLAVSDSGATNLVQQYLAGATTPRFLVRTSGVDQAVLDGASSATAVNKMANAYKTDDFASVVNGGAAATDTSGSVPAVDRVGIGSRLGSLVWNGHIRSIAYYPTRLTDAQLQALTA